jgi:hypothetical protein
VATDETELAPTANAFGGLAFIVDPEKGMAVAFDIESGWAVGPVFTDGMDEAIGFIAFVQACGIDRFADLDLAGQKTLYEGYLTAVEELDQTI